MDISNEILATTIAIAFGLVRIVEFLIVKGFSVVTGKKSTMDTIAGNLDRATNNHLHTIEETLKESGKITHDDHSKQIELLTEIAVTLRERKR